MLWRVTVQKEDPSKPQGFSPQLQQSQAGDGMFWYNEDENTPHQPVPDTGTWNIPEIPPRNSSDQLSLGNPGTYPYHCALHTGETGSVVVANAVLIAAGADPLFGATAISTGQCVSWGNSDTQAHQPTPNSGEAWFDAPIPSGDLSKSVSFPNNGTFDYHCSLHPDNPDETGTITVTTPQST